MANNPSQTHNSAQAIAVMSAYGSLGGSPEWHQLKPTDIAGVLATTSDAQHDTIDPSNQYEAGSVVGLEAKPTIAAGFTYQLAQLLLPMAMRTQWTPLIGATSGPRSLDATAYRPTSATSAHYVHPSITTALPVSTLVKVTGCATTANNGVKVVSGVPSATNTPVSGGLTAETFTAAQNVTLEVCGFQFSSGDATITVSGSTITLGTTTKDLTELGLVAGQPIFIGDSSAAAYSFATAASNGPARVLTIAANAITLDSTFTTFASDSGTSKTIRIFFGQSCRIVPRTSANYVESYFQTETGVENLGSANATRYLYAENGAIDTLTIAAPAAALATMTANVMATDVTDTDTQRTNASTPTLAKRTIAYNTTTDVSGRLFLSSDGTALTGYITGATITIENQAAANPAHGVLGSAITSFGKLRVKLAITAFLTESGIIAAARSNYEVRGNVWLRNGDGAIVFDIPSARLKTPSASFPKGQIVTIDAEMTANADTTWSTSLIASKIPGCPALPSRS
jgi:hypothetical protein